MLDRQYIDATSAAVRQTVASSQGMSCRISQLTRAAPLLMCHFHNRHATSTTLCPMLLHYLLGLDTSIKRAGVRRLHSGGKKPRRRNRILDEGGGKCVRRLSPGVVVS
ncbi:hypothetical protein J6590_001686 [Homalodisca vitripennis]|nr:hypothetical protein J6590_001686 [Homalodisca vitripennis]